jgi:hypothetical protein
MKPIEHSVKSLIAAQFPGFYREEGPLFVEFVKEYISWLQSTNNPLFHSRRLLEYRDIDQTVDQFITHFKDKYLSGINFDTTTNKRFLVKHIQDIYRSKGSQQSIDLIFRLVFNEAPSFYYPGHDVLKPSDGKWVIPKYIELTPLDTNSRLQSKQIKGLSSGATAFVENIIRRRFNGRYVDIAYLSNLQGNFEFNEIVSDSDSVVNAPKVTGSVNTIDIITSGQDFSVGDEVLLLSNTIEGYTGSQGKGIVTGIDTETGIVNFEILDGGWGFTVSVSNTSTSTTVAQKMIRFSGLTNSNSAITDFSLYETVTQPLGNLVFSTANNTFTVGDVIETYNADNTLKANGVIVAATANSTAGSMLVQKVSGNVETGSTANATASPVLAAGAIRKQGNSITALITSTTNETVTANLFAQNATFVGVINVTSGKAFSNGPGNFFYGLTSNSYANVLYIGTGASADFEIGSTTLNEDVTIYPDLLRANNTGNVAFMDLKVTGAGSNIGSKDVKRFLVYEGGTGYDNVDTISTTGGGGSGATGSIVTNTTGGIVSATVTAGGSNYTGNPTIVVSGGGSGANIVASFAYGFIKFPAGHANTLIFDLLRTASLTIGEIVSLTGINPGSNYNTDPFIEVRNQDIAGYNKKDYVLSISTPSISFIVGETVEQTTSTATKVITFNTFAGGTAANGTSTTNFDVGEQIFQTVGGSEVANGIVVSSALTNSTAGSVEVRDIVGTFVNTSPNILASRSSNVTANAIIVTTDTLDTIAKGIVQSGSNSSTLFVKRITFGTDFLPVASFIVGKTSGACSSITSVGENSNSRPIGLNANIAANASTANGVLASVSIIDSGFAYSNSEIVTISKSGNPFIGTGKVTLSKQGTGEGFYKDQRGYVSGKVYIHDGEYYQDYSYEVQSRLAFEKYSDMLKNVVHVAGTKMFGSIQLSSDVDLSINRNIPTVDRFINLTIADRTGTFTVGETVHQPNVASSVATGVVTFGNSTFLTLKTITGDFVANTATDANRTIQGANSSATANATAVNIEII